MTQKDVDKIVLDYLFAEDSNTFDEILCSDEAYKLLSDENAILLITKKMVETEN